MIENASGWRRALVLLMLLVASWVAAALAISIAGGVTAAFAKAPTTATPSSSGVAAFLSLAGANFLEIIVSAAQATIVPFLALWPPAWGSLLSNWPIVGFCLIFMIIAFAPTLVLAPLVGLRVRGRVSLRWSIAGGGLLGGLLGVGLILCLMDMLRLLDWALGIELGLLDPTRPGSAVLLFLCWIVTGGIWAWALARAGRSGHPDAIAQFVRRLFRGTVVELAIAAPTYALAIRRNDCWCGWGSWFAIVGGVAILTVLCGPALILLWTREARLQWVRRCCQECGYPLRTGAAVCPECGRPSEPEAPASLNA